MYYNIIRCGKTFDNMESEVIMEVMTDKQMQFIAWLITTATDKCQTMDEVREMNKEIRKHSVGFKEESEEQKKDV